MNPTQVPKRDWRLYYNNTWMRHVEHGPVHVRVVNDGATYLQYAENVPTEPGINIYDDGKQWVNAPAKDLKVWWPRAGAYNIEGSAVYIGRRSSRCMSKSAKADKHYYRAWGRARGWMRALADGPNYVTWNTATEMLDKGIISSCAITRDIIITSPNDDGRYTVVFRGEEVGYMQNREFYPSNDYAPSTKRVFYKLMKEGIIQ